MNDLGVVAGCWRYPVKSMQGLASSSVDIDADGVRGDRRWALIDDATGHLVSAKRDGSLLGAVGSDDTAVLPDGTEVDLAGPGASARLSAWLERPVRVAARSEISATEQLSYEMTFDPPDDDAEYYEIPAPTGTFLDLAPLHLVTTTTLDHCAQARPDLNWDVRRFRPNLLFDTGTGTEAVVEPFVENGWVDVELMVGPDVVIRVISATVRCAMPLRAQPGLHREPELFSAMTQLNESIPNHLGAYAEVISPGTVRVGDAVSRAAPGD